MVHIWHCRSGIGLLHALLIHHPAKRSKMSPTVTFLGPSTEKKVFALQIIANTWYICRYLELEVNQTVASLSSPKTSSFSTFIGFYDPTHQIVTLFFYNTWTSILNSHKECIVVFLFRRFKLYTLLFQEFFVTS